MNKLTITFNIKGKRKKFKAPKSISSSVFKQTLELEKDLQAFRDEAIIFKKCFPLICEVFGNQFTPEQLEKGLDIRKVVHVTNEVVDYVIHQMRISNNVVLPQKEGVVIEYERYRKAKRNQM